MGIRAKVAPKSYTIVPQPTAAANLGPSLEVKYPPMTIANGKQPIN
jgi:hypothetical protein